MRRRWRVQAFLSEALTGIKGGFPYQPRFFYFKWSAWRWANKLAGDFAPGMADVRVDKIP